MKKPAAAGRVATMALTLAAAACGQREADFCGAIKAADVEQALGVPLAGEAARVSASEPEIACTWNGQTPDGAARNLALSVQRNAGAAAFDHASEDMRAAYGRVGTLADIGDAAVMGVGAANAEHFAGQIVARKGADLLVLRIEGRDPVAFETVARAAAQAM